MDYIESTLSQNSMHTFHSNHNLRKSFAIISISIDIQYIVKKLYNETIVNLIEEWSIEVNEFNGIVDKLVDLI